MKYILICCITFSLGSVISQESTSIQFKFTLDDKLNIETLKFYITNIKLTLKNNEIFAEENSCHLVDITNKDSQTILIKSINPLNIKSIQYSIGTDSISNVSGILDGDLDPINGMYWAWNSGYINFKLEGAYFENSNLKPIELHIGGYNSDQATIQHVVYNLTTNNYSSIIIDVNPNTLIEQLDLESQNEVMIPGKKAVEISKMLPSIFTIRE